MFFQPGVELTGRKVQGRYEKIEKEFMVLYKNPGTNASDKQLQALLKATGKKKDEQNDERMESAKEKADKTSRSTSGIWRNSTTCAGLCRRKPPPRKLRRPTTTMKRKQKCAASSRKTNSART